MDLMASLEFVRAYMDDLLINTRGILDDHLQKMETVLTRLHDTDVSRLQMYRTNVPFGMPDQGQMLDV